MHRASLDIVQYKLKHFTISDVPLIYLSQYLTGCVVSIQFVPVPTAADTQATSVVAGLPLHPKMLV